MWLELKINKSDIVIISCVLAIISFSAEACKITKDSSWYFSDDKFLTTIKSAWVGRVISISDRKKFPKNQIVYVMKINEVLVGTREVCEESKLVSYNLRKGVEVSYDSECNLGVKLEKNKSYIVIDNSFHPKTIVELSESNHSWYERIKKLTKK